MKKAVIALAAAGVITGCAPKQEAQAPAPELKLESNNQQVSYGMGLVMGERMTSDLPDLQLEQFIEGFRHGHSGDENARRMSEAEIQSALIAYQQEMQQEAEAQRKELAEKNKAAGEAFLAENAEKEGVEVTDSGLQIEILEEGNGEKPTAEDRVQVHYTGKLLSGEVFDSSHQRGQPATFGLNQVISGWTEGLQLISKGGKANLYIPSDLAYGEMGNQRIGPNETLIFEVELLDINPEQ